VLLKKEEARYKDQLRMVRSLARRGQLRPEISARRAADIVWALASELTYLALVRDRGWSGDDYERWLVDQLQATLLPDSTAD
jgi:hypothetical protein